MRTRPPRPGGPGALLPALLWAALAPAAAAEPRATLQVEPDEATVGDPITVTISVEAPEGAAVAFPPEGGGWGPLTLLEAGVPRREPREGGSRTSAAYVLTGYEPGEVEIAARSVRVGEGEAATEVAVPAARVTIRSVLGDDEGEEADLADIRPPALLPFPVRWLSWLLAAGLAVLAAALWLWLRRRRTGEGAGAVPEPPPPADQEALAALDRLLAGELLREGRIEEFHVELAEITKRYLWRRFGVATLERTTFEVLRDARGAGLEGTVTDRLASVLDGCDGVKFARQRPPAGRSRAAAEEARDLILRTRPAPAPAGEPVGSAAAEA